jgi:hypothetical protein
MLKFLKKTYCYSVLHLVALFFPLFFLYVLIRDVLEAVSYEVQEWWKQAVEDTRALPAYYKSVMKGIKEL